MFSGMDREQWHVRSFRRSFLLVTDSSLVCLGECEETVEEHPVCPRFLTRVMRRRRRANETPLLWEKLVYPILFTDDIERMPCGVTG